MTNDLNHYLDSAPFSIDEVVSFLSSLGSALHDLHNGDELWDQSCQRVLLDQDGRVTAVGALSTIRRRLGEGEIDVHRDLLPPEYMENGPHDARGDVYALGVVGYELVTGQSPFQGESVYKTMTARLRKAPIKSIEEYRPDCPETLKKTIMKSLSINPAERFQTVREVLDALSANS